MNTDKHNTKKELVRLVASPPFFLTVFFLTNFLLSGFTAPAQNALTDHFVLKITTTGANESFTFYTQDTDYDIDWNNDGTFENTTAFGNQRHTFRRAGVRTIRLRNLNDIHVGSQPDKTKYTSIEQWGTAVWNADMSGAFSGASNLTGNYTDTPNMSAVTNMSQIFAEAAAFNQNIGNWNTANVTDMSGMFQNAAAFNQNIGNWNTANVTDMGYMFAGAIAFNQDIGDWNTENVTDMRGMFNNAQAFNGDIGSWNTENVLYMNYMFENARAFNQDIGKWNTENVLYMNYMFENARAFNQDIGSWNTERVTGMRDMFGNAHSFNQNIGGWNTEKVTDMYYMFYDATAFNQNLGRWYVQDAVYVKDGIDAGSAFGVLSAQNSYLKRQNLVYTITGGADRATFSLSSDGVLTIGESPSHARKASYTLEVTATGGFSSPNSRTITVHVDATAPSDDFVTVWKTTAANESITFPGTGNYTIDWGDGTVLSVHGSASHTYATAGSYTVSGHPIP